MIRCPERDGGLCDFGKTCLVNGRCMVPVGDGHHESALSDDKDQAQDTTVVAESDAFADAPPEITQAIPPVYTEWIGSHLVDGLGVSRAAG